VYYYSTTSSFSLTARSPFSMTNSNVSSATITSIAVFENGRPAEGNGTMTLIFDAQIYVRDDCPPLLAAVCYFNSENHVFNEIGFYFIIASVTSIHWHACITLIFFIRLQRWSLVHILHFKIILALMKQTTMLWVMW